ncbi:hypothetical protein X566_19140 [Afipia sp. P52-10]|nr:hypothetical protein X566_19140 [Afipia sp. P52-10]
MAHKSDDVLNLDSLLHPAAAFDHPRDVLSDPDLTLNEKRAILASWASDACAVEAAPALRQTPDGKKVVRFDDIIEALRELDREARVAPMPARNYRRVLEKERGLFKFRRRKPDDGRGGTPLQ